MDYSKFDGIDISDDDEGEHSDEADSEEHRAHWAEAEEWVERYKRLEAKEKEAPVQAPAAPKAPAAPAEEPPAAPVAPAAAPAEEPLAAPGAAAAAATASHASPKARVVPPVAPAVDYGPELRSNAELLEQDRALGAVGNDLTWLWPGERWRYYLTACSFGPNRVALEMARVRAEVPGLGTVGEVVSALSAGRGSPVPSMLAVTCLLYTSPSPRDATLSRMPSSA